MDCQLRVPHRLDALCEIRGVFKFQVVRYLAAHTLGFFERIEAINRKATALADGAVKQAPGQRRGNQRGGIVGAGRLAKHCHIFRVAAKSRDVVLHPLQCGDLIENAVIAGDTLLRFS